MKRVGWRGGWSGVRWGVGGGSGINTNMTGMAVKTGLAALGFSPDLHLITAGINSQDF